MSPGVQLQRWTNGNRAWCVYVSCKGHVAETTTATAAIAAMRLLGGPEAVARNAEYLRAIGCREGHECLDALEGRIT